MTKPLETVTLWTADESSSREVVALFDTGSYRTIVRETALPPGATVIRYGTPKELQTASPNERLRIVGQTILIVQIRDKKIDAIAYVASELPKDFLIGAGTMQMWDIHIRNENGSTRVEVGLDMSDPDVTMVL